MRPSAPLLLSILFLLASLLALAADAAANLRTEASGFQTLGAVLARWGVDPPTFQASAAGPSDVMSRLAGAAWGLPAFVPPLAVAVSLGLLAFGLARRRARRSAAATDWGGKGLAPAGGAAAALAAGGTKGGTKAQPKAEPMTQDSEFLPAALEILVTPPSPVAVWLIALITATVLFGLTWSYLGWLDIYAVAPGRIQLSGRSKVVQPFEPGRVLSIRVTNGQRVAAGEVLLELDPTETGADRVAVARALESARAEATQRTATIAAVRKADLTRISIPFGADIGASVRSREQGLAEAALAQLAATLDNFEAQIAEKNATKARLHASIDTRANLIALARERVSMREELEKKGASSRALLIEAQQQLESYLTTNASEKGQLLEEDAAIESLRSRHELAIAQFIADQTRQLVEIEQKRDSLEQEFIKLRSKNERTTLKAPINGTVQQLNVTTVGQVVTTGQALLTIVPLDEELEVEAMITNKDIGFVKAGQHAVVKIDAFPFTRYGTIDAEVVRVSRDAVDEQSAAQMSDAATLARPQPTSGGATSQPQRLVFPATLRLARHSIAIDGEDVPLVSGMAVLVEVKTGARRAIDYVLAPLREMTANAAHER